MIEAGALNIIQNDILAELAGIPEAKTVGAWQGEIDDLLKMPQKLPSLNVVYQGAQFEPFDQVGEPSIASLDYLIILIVQNQKSRESASVVAYTIIEAVRDKLIGHTIEGYGFLRPIDEHLIIATGGILAYGLTYSMNNVLAATE